MRLPVDDSVQALQRAVGGLGRRHHLLLPFLLHDLGPLLLLLPPAIIPIVVPISIPVPAVVPSCLAAAE